LGGFEKQCEELEWDVPEMKFLEVKKVVKKQINGE
jgi:hypothetical protein